MSEFKGTKAPWTYDVDQQSVLNENGFIIADIFPGDKLENGLLISKAPEMLEMLKEVLAGRIRPREYQSEWDMVNELIKSATTI